MDRKSFGMGFMLAIAAILAVSVLYYGVWPVEAAAPTDPRQWCESENAGYTGALSTRIVRNNAWAIMTANIYAIYDTADRSNAPPLSEKEARDKACEILYNVYHPEAHTP